MWKLDLKQVAELVKENPDKYRKEVPLIQTAVYVMCGCGFLGDFAARQPADFYIDTRVGKLPYGKRVIEQAVKVLRVIAEGVGLDPHDMPRPHFHNCGIS